MSIILSQCFRVRCEPKYIVMKSETSVKHHRESQKEIGLYSGKHDKKIKNIRKYKKNGSSFLQKSLQYAGTSVLVKV